MQTGCSLIKKDGEKGGVYYYVALQRSNMRQEGKIMFNLDDFTLHNVFFFNITIT
jgi:hypothetical protein